jgi:hypothetical protein
MRMKGPTINNPAVKASLVAMTPPPSARTNFRSHTSYEPSGDRRSAPTRSLFSPTFEPRPEKNPSWLRERDADLVAGTG